MSTLRQLEFRSLNFEAKDDEITLKTLEFILNSIEKVKSGLLLSSMRMFPESNGTNFWSQSVRLQDPGILQARIAQSGDSMKKNFDNFQIQKWILHTNRDQKADKKIGVICLVSFFASWVMVSVLVIMLWLRV